MRRALAFSLRGEWSRYAPFRAAWNRILKGEANATPASRALHAWLTARPKRMERLLREQKRWDQIQRAKRNLRIKPVRKTVQKPKRRGK